MSFLSKWEKDLLSTLVMQYESGDFNCGANDDEKVLSSCPKDDEHIICPDCSKCRFKKRFETLKKKVGAF